MFARYLLGAITALAIAPQAPAQGLFNQKAVPEHTRLRDEIYHRKDGVALTMDVCTPRRSPNGLGVILCVSAEFKSGREMLDRLFPFAAGEFLDRGYVVFLVTHGSQPRFTVPEIVEDMHRAVRFIKHNARAYKVDPGRLAVAGASSGGLLSLMVGCAGGVGDPKSKDRVDHESSSVAAVGCIFPVTDFRSFEKSPPPGFDPAVLFPHRELDARSGRYVPVTSERRFEIGVACSPLLRAREGAAPTLIIHGDADKLVPLKQSVDMRDRLLECKGRCELEIRKGMGHDPLAALGELPNLARWFDHQLLGKK